MISGLLIIISIENHRKTNEDAGITHIMSLTPIITACVKRGEREKSLRFPNSSLFRHVTHLEVLNDVTEIEISRKLDTSCTVSSINCQSYNNYHHEKSRDSAKVNNQVQRDSLML